MSSSIFTVKIFSEPEGYRMAAEFPTTPTETAGFSMWLKDLSHAHERLSDMYTHYENMTKQGVP